MVFNSYQYFIFLPIVFILYWVYFKNSIKQQNFVLLISSYIFYSWWSWKFLLLLILSTLLDYIYGHLVAGSNKNIAKLFLILSLVNNLGILFVFKYYNFFANELIYLLQKMQIHANIKTFELVLPIGISFFTFHGMSYIIDIYTNKQKPLKNIVDYSLFVSFFPLLVAGPIERANHFIPQIQNSRKFNYINSVHGCRLILWGMIKKVLIADNLAIIVDSVFSNYKNENSLTLIVGAIYFSFQIYCDFSGYSDIAIGTAKLFGFELLSNFKFPYFSRNLSEFWRRWHISLSSWFRDYLYIPLGGSKFGSFINMRNIFIIFILSGFWHGANWKYIVWGSIHSFAYVILLLIKNIKFFELFSVKNRFPFLIKLVQVCITFMFVTFAWIFFRANNISHAIGYIKRMFLNMFHDPSEILHWSNTYLAFPLILFLLIGDWKFRLNEREISFVKSKYLRRFFYFIMIIFCYLSVMSNQNTNFIYFQF